MEEQLGKILRKYEYKILEYEMHRDKLLSQSKFYKEHNLLEEHRVATMKYQTLVMCLSHFRGMYAEVQELLNAWEG